MSRKPKAHISLKKKLAAALRCLKVEIDGQLVDAVEYSHAKQLSDEQIISLFNFDHGIHEAIDGPTEHWNLTPRLIAEHRRKTAKVDRPQISKTDRIEDSHEAFRRKMLAKAGQNDDGNVEKISTKPKQKIRSRGFQKRPEGHKYNWGKGKMGDRR